MWTDLSAERDIGAGLETRDSLLPSCRGSRDLTQRLGCVIAPLRRSALVMLSMRWIGAISRIRGDRLIRNTHSTASIRFGMTPEIDLGRFWVGEEKALQV
jgi:hypothetical protein